VIGVDTNVIVRLLVGDDERQAQAAAQYLKDHCSGDEPAVMSDIVLVEGAWVLEDLYNYSRAQIGDAIEGLLSTTQLRAINASAVTIALRLFRSSSADFADCLLGVTNNEAGCEFTATFDRKTSKLSQFKLISVS
jgi:predicted nucleic-acid-binding protein